MKRIWFLAILLFPVMTFSQSFSALEGMEDQFGNTHLFYRVFNNIGVSHDSIYNNVYHWNLAANTDSLYFLDYYYYENSLPHFSYNKTLGFKFFDNNPDHYIKWGERGKLDYYGYIKKYNNLVGFEQPNTSVLSVELKDNDTLYAGTDYRLAKSTDGGNSFQYLANSLPEFRFIKYEAGDKLYGNNLLGKLVISTDEGKTVSLVDTNCSLHNFIYLDKNPLYKYRLINNNGYSKLMVSNNNGNAFSWSNKYESNNKLYFAQDNNQQGSVYLADGKNVLSSNNYGESWLVVKQLQRKITGFYKKPGADKFYVTSKLNLFEVTPDSIKIIKKLPVPQNVLDYNPLDNGLKIIYHFSSYGGYPYWEEYNYDYSVEVIKDTLMDNGKIYKQLKHVDTNNKHTTYEYQRIDSSECLVYRYQQGYTGGEYLAEDLLSEVGDTIPNRRMELFGGHNSVLIQEDTAMALGEKRRVKSYSLCQSLDIVKYNLVQGVGVDSVIFGFDFCKGIGRIVVKGMVKNGIVYGDTTMVTGVESNSAVVNSYGLEQNYPNPFNPATNINFSLAKGDKVEIIVYDVLGNKIATLLEGYKPAGNHSIQFNAKNLPSGVYIYRIKSGAFMAAKKMVLVK